MADEPEPRRRISLKLAPAPSPADKAEAEALFQRATRRRRAKRFEEALGFYDQALALDPLLASAHNDRGRTLAALGRPDAAIASYRKAIASDPSYAGSARNIGVIEEGRDRLDAAAEAYRQAIRIKPDYATAHNNLGVVLEKMGQEVEALKSYRDTVDADPKHALGHRNAGLMLMRAGRLDEALPYLRKSLRLLVDRAKPVRFQVTGTHSGFSHGRAEEALFRIKAVFERLDLPFFLCFGTLLGHVREGGFMVHDQDIDLGIWHGVDCVALVEALTADGFTLNPGQMWDGLLEGGVARLPIKAPNRISIDIYPHVEEDGVLWSAIGHGATELRWEFTPFGLAPARFMDGEFLVPDPVERYLDEGYGDWRRPDPFFEGTFSAPNIAGGFPPIARCYAYYFTARAAYEGEWERTWHFLSQIAALDPADSLARTLLDDFEPPCDGDGNWSL